MIQAACLLLLSLAITARTAADVHQQRADLIALFEAEAPERLDVFVHALEDPAAYIRRTAAFLLARSGAAGEEGLEQALDHADLEVRMIALNGLLELDRLQGGVGRIYGDADVGFRRGASLSLVHLMATRPHLRQRWLLRLESYTREVSTPVEARYRALQSYLQAMADEEAIDRSHLEQVVKQFYAKGGRVYEEEIEQSLGVLREDEFARMWERPNVGVDPAVREVEVVRLPADGWRFYADRRRVGHEEDWFAVDYDDTGWQEVAIETYWHSFLGETYVGVGWYRRDFEAPEIAADASVLVHLAGVDENGWVWVNGVYVGQQNLGPNGWDRPFWLDVTKLIRSGERNQITVRVRNTMFAGGIWRPVELVILERAVETK